VREREREKRKEEKRRDEKAVLYIVPDLINIDFFTRIKIKIKKIIRTPLPEIKVSNRNLPADRDIGVGICSCI